MGDAEVDDERDQVLLGPVVDVAFQSPPFGVMGVDDTSARDLEGLGQGCQVLGPLRQLDAQPSTVEHQTRLGREVGEQAFLDRRQRLVGALLEPQDAEPHTVERDVERSHAGLVAVRPGVVGDRLPVARRPPAPVRRRP